MSKAFFAGSFNPFTIGHQDIVERALRLFDSVVIAIGVNVNKDASAPLLHAEELRSLYATNPRVTVVEYTGLTVDAALVHGATCLLRGLRDEQDFAYERKIADVNRNISGLETVFILADPALAWVSSTVVRELQHFGKDAAHLLPKIDRSQN